jgi:hypothetical protein
VLCDGVLCSPDDICCVDVLGGAGTCDLEIDCEGQVIACDGPEDCDGGDVCCVGGNGPDAGTQECGPRGNQCRAEVCRVDADCGADRECCDPFLPEGPRTCQDTCLGQL